MANQFTKRHRVEFSDTDAAGLAHFTAFFRWMEQTEHAFYDSMGATAFERTDEGLQGVPRVSASCDFRRPIEFGDEVDVRLTVEEKGSRKLAFRFDFTTHPGGEDVATGRMTVVSALRPGDGGPFRSTPLPDPMSQGIEAGG